MPSTDQTLTLVMKGGVGLKGRISTYNVIINEELANALLDDMDFDRYDKVMFTKIEGMLTKLMKMVEGEMRNFSLWGTGELERKKLPCGKAQVAVQSPNQ